jgi:mono/diheme cytochrome c family protein
MRKAVGCVVAGAVLGLLAGFGWARDAGAETPVERGKYLVTVIGCSDCHTDGSFAGKPDMAHFLGGSSVGFEVPGLGYFYGSNLTPDAETGLGKWSAKEIVTAITTGVRPDGRELAPIMPWRGLSHLKPNDAKAIAAYLKSLPPVHNKVPGPFGASEKPTAPYFKVLAP